MRRIRWGLLALALCVFCAFPAFWRNRIMLPAANALSWLTAHSPIPFYAILLALCLLSMRRPRHIAFMLAASLILLWAPAYCIPAAPISPASEAQVHALCIDLIDTLNASPLEFSGAALPQAIAAIQASTGCRLPEYSIKAGPERILSALNLAGIYIPWTAEALVNPSVNAAALPFTAVHELMHRLGIANETEANRAAWQICIQAGGELADSARLWALRYAMARERETNAAEWRALVRRMNASTRERFIQMGGGGALSGSEAYARLIDILATELNNERRSTLNRRSFLLIFP